MSQQAPDWPFISTASCLKTLRAFGGYFGPNRDSPAPQFSQQSPSPPLCQHPCLSIRSAHTHPPLARGGRVVCLPCSPSQSVSQSLVLVSQYKWARGVSQSVVGSLGPARGACSCGLPPTPSAPDAWPQPQRRSSSFSHPTCYCRTPTPAPPSVRAPIVVCLLCKSSPSVSPW